MKNAIAVLYCGSHLAKSLYDRLLHLLSSPILLPSETSIDDLYRLEPLGIIITGSPSYPGDPRAEQIDQRIYEAGIPILGICYGMQRMAIDLGGEVLRMYTPEREIKHLNFSAGKRSELYRDFTDEGAPVWMVHTCKVSKMPPGFRTTGYTKATEIASMQDDEKRLFGVQYHPEYRGNHTGTAVLWRFLHDVCGVR